MPEAPRLTLPQAGQRAWAGATGVGVMRPWLARASGTGLANTVRVGPGLLLLEQQAHPQIPHL